MQIAASAISLNVNDVTASAKFAKQYFGFIEEMAADGFVSLQARRWLQPYLPPNWVGKL